MCCFDAPLPAPRKPSMADKATAAYRMAKIKTRAAVGAKITRAKRLAAGIKKTGGGMVPFNSNRSGMA